MTKRPALSLPALRGFMGDWIYYAVLMSMKDISERVTLAKVLHKNERLADMIQRELVKTRVPQIAEYLRTQPQRFLGALVVAAYGGSPNWHPARLTGARDVVATSAKELGDTLGVLSLAGKEKLFVLDGQHRLIGMQLALEAQKSLGDELVPVLLVAHTRTAAGLTRTRRLFTTLNKTAYPVRKGEIIALDENDPAAIVTRTLVDSHPWFTKDRVAYKNSPNLTAADRGSITTVSVLYDTLGLLFRSFAGVHRTPRTIPERPTDATLESLKGLAVRYFTLLADAYPPVGRFFSARSPEGVVSRYRTEDGGHFLFRPIGLLAHTAAVCRISGGRVARLEAAVRSVSRLPVRLNQRPHVDVIWDRTERRMKMSGRALLVKLLVFLVGSDADSPSLRVLYARRTGIQLRPPLRTAME